MRVLGIETSCDETGIAVYDGERGLLAQAVYSQVPITPSMAGWFPSWPRATMCARRCH